jgi:hypothetical protein
MTKKELTNLMHDAFGRSSSISASLFLIDKKGTLNEEQKEWLNKANERLKELNKLLDNFYEEQKIKVTN